MRIESTVHLTCAGYDCNETCGRRLNILYRTLAGTRRRRGPCCENSREIHRRTQTTYEKYLDYSICFFFFTKRTNVLKKWYLLKKNKTRV